MNDFALIISLLITIKNDIIFLYHYQFNSSIIIYILINILFSNFITVFNTYGFKQTDHMERNNFMEIEYRPIVASDYSDIIAITDSCVNDGKESHAYIKETCNNLGKNSLGVLAQYNKEVIGVCLVEKGMKLSGGREDFFPEIRNDIGCDEIWSTSIIAIKELYQKMHIGSEMLKHLITTMRQFGIKHLLCEIWVHPDKTEPSLNLTKDSHSTTDYGIVPEFYNTPFFRGQVCRFCGTVCHCSARILVMHLFNEGKYDK